MSTRLLTSVGAALVALTATLGAQQTLTQTLPVGFDNTDGPATSPYTFGTFPNLDQVWQFHYSSSNFNQTGPIQITELYIRPDRGSASLSAFNFNDITIVMADALTGYQVGQHMSTFAANYGPNVATVRSGPWSGGPVPASASSTGTWVALGLTQSFTYDPTLGLDLIIEVSRCGGGTPWSANADHVSGTAIGGNRYGAVGSCSATSSTVQGNEFVPIFRLDYVPQGGFSYETNDAAATLTVDGVAGDVFNKATLQRCLNNVVQARFATTNVGLGWDVGVNAAPLVTAFTGGITSASGQIVNLDFSVPTAFLNGGAFPDLVNSAFPAPELVIPVTLPPATGFLSAQSVHADPTNPDGIAISQGSEVEILMGSGTVPGPTGDDSFVTVPLAGPNLCGPAGFPIYGTRYTEIHVISNGRITFGRADTQFAPTSVLDAQNGQPFFGAWTDFDPLAGGTVTVNNASGVVRVDYGMVPYWSGGGGLNTFALELDPNGSQVRMMGLLGLTSSTTDNMFLGISPGLPGGATDPGPADFTLLSGTTTNATDMIYEYGAAGSLAAGIDTIIFTPNAAGNYDWISL